jgi:hypothetical protein
MALTRKMLKGMGLTEEQIDTIIEAHTDTVNALKDERDKYKDDAEKLPGVQSELDELKKKAGDGFEQKYKDLQKEYEDYKKDQEDKANRAAVSDAYKEMLKEAGISEKRIPAVLRVADLSGIKLDKDGNIKDKDKLVESVKEEWSDFIQAKGAKGADTKTPPDNNGGTLTKDDILKIKDAGERQQKIAENHELFGF